MGSVAEPCAGVLCPRRARIALHDEVRTGNVWMLRDIVFSHAEGLKKNFPETDPDGAFTGLVIVFPLLPEGELGGLDEIHTQLKSDLMAHDVMLSPFYASSVKPSISNPEFHVFQSPLPCFVMRHVDVRDIVFLSNNPLAFARYHSRFAEKFRTTRSRTSSAMWTGTTRRRRGTGCAERLARVSATEPARALDVRPAGP